MTKNNNLPLDFFTVEESNLISMYMKTSRMDMIEQLNNAIDNVRNLEMAELIYKTIDKLNKISDADFEAMEFVEAEE